jgi:hypothetical protein
VETAEQGLDLLDKGTCGAVVLFEDAWMNYYRAEHGRHCNKMRVGTPLYTVQNAMPVRSDLNAALSWAIAKALGVGLYAQQETAAKAVYWTDGQCKGGSTILDGGFKPMTLVDFSGPLLFTFVCSTAGLVLSCCNSGSTARKAATSAASSATSAVRKLSAQGRPMTWAPGAADCPVDNGDPPQRRARGSGLSEVLNVKRAARQWRRRSSADGGGDGSADRPSSESSAPALPSLPVLQRERRASASLSPVPPRKDAGGYDGGGGGNGGGVGAAAASADTRRAESPVSLEELASTMDGDAPLHVG